MNSIKQNYIETIDFKAKNIMLVKQVIGSEINKNGFTKIFEFPRKRTTIIKFI
jgi:hypothetical protein